MSDIEFQFYEDQKGRRIEKGVVFYSAEKNTKFFLTTTPKLR